MNYERMIYNIFVQEHPGLVEAISDLLRAGQTPAQIEAFIARKTQEGVVVSGSRVVADYLQKQPKS